MKISFKNRKLQRAFESEASLKRIFGARMLRAIKARISVLEDSSCLADVPTIKPERCHQLKGKRDEQFAVDLVQPYRMVFEVNHDPMPRDEFGGIDKKRVIEIMILEVVDYH